MKATDTEKQIIECLKNCSYLPGSFDKKFPNKIDVDNISPRQKYYIYFLGYKYRKQIGNDILTTICELFIDSNKPPKSRRESEKIIKSTKPI